MHQLQSRALPAELRRDDCGVAVDGVSSQAHRRTRSRAPSLWLTLFFAVLTSTSVSGNRRSHSPGRFRKNEKWKRHREAGCDHQIHKGAFTAPLLHNTTEQRKADREPRGRYNSCGVFQSRSASFFVNHKTISVRSTTSPSFFASSLPTWGLIRTRPFASSSGATMTANGILSLSTTANCAAGLGLTLYVNSACNHGEVSSLPPPLPQTHLNPRRPQLCAHPHPLLQKPVPNAHHEDLGCFASATFQAHLLRLRQK